MAVRVLSLLSRWVTSCMCVRMLLSSLVHVNGAETSAAPVTCEVGIRIASRKSLLLRRSSPSREWPILARVLSSMACAIHLRPTLIMPFRVAT